MSEPNDGEQKEEQIIQIEPDNLLTILYQQLKYRQQQTLVYACMTAIFGFFNGFATLLELALCVDVFNVIHAFLLMLSLALLFEFSCNRHIFTLMVLTGLSLADIVVCILSECLTNVMMYIPILCSCISTLFIMTSYTYATKCYIIYADIESHNVAIGRQLRISIIDRIDRISFDNAIKISNICVICQHDFEKDSQEEIKKLTCSHIFHKTCIINWISSDNITNSNCPICKANI